MAIKLDIEVATGRKVAFPTAKTLDAFEERHQFKLPTAYRRFALKYGYGIIGGFYIVYVPNTIRSSNKMSKLNKQRWRLYPPLEENEEETAMVNRAVYFCRSMGGDYLAWDPEDIRNPRTHEYGIYAYPRYNEKIPLVAKSFDEFLENLINGKLPRALGFEGKSTRVKKQFLQWSKK